MPWHLIQRDGKTCVAKKGTDEIVPGGCHSSHEEAVKHMSALYANEPMVAAAVAPLAPPKEWFDTPEPDRPEPLTVEDDGRVHGHLALWGACHTGILNGAMARCVQPPRSRSKYQGFHLGQLKTEDGTMVPVGKIVYDGPHASLTADLAAATRHYDDTGKVAAFVQARDGEHGIYLTGATRSDLSPEGLRDLRANPPSGDWRDLRGKLEMIAALAVPVPGFQTPQVALTASGAVEALILPGYCAECDEDEEIEMEVIERGDKTYIRRRAMIASAIEDGEQYLDVVALVAAARTFTSDQRKRYASTGVAMADGSYPIPDCDAWDRARQSIGRTPPSRRAAVRRHIARRGAVLGCKAGD